ncbi:MAG TPA: PQQ-binding-like beta-propeller repeat protein [Bryobacteraceae bacterium]|nr:PQQ-binding-like beta-propeller repeat protein [Bryobacteraceae bacterium]
MRTWNAVALSFSCALACTGTAHAQRGGGLEWSTAGGDAQRSSWVRNDAKISVDRMQKGGFGVAWKIKLSGEPTTASVLDRYIGYRGFRSYAFAGTASGELIAIDSDLGRVEWTKKIGSGPKGTAACSGGMTSNIARNVSPMFPAAPAGRMGGGFGRGGPAKSDVGQANEGAVTIAPALANANAAAARGGRGAAAFPGMPGARGASGATGAPMPPRRMGETLVALSSDGSLHDMYVSNGEEPTPPIPFVPANSNARDLALVNNVAYVATSQGCGGAANGVWAVDMNSKQVNHWSPASGDIAGSGFAFGPDSKVYASTTSGDLVALDPAKMQPAGVYRASGQKFSSSPIVLDYKTKPLVAAATEDGHIHLVDGVGLTGSAFSGAASGPLATWSDPNGTNWIVAPSKNNIAAWKVTGDTPSLQSGWTSPEIASPMPPIIVDGVIFTVSNSPSAVLHALDGATGKELWNSGKTMTAAVRIGSLSSGNDQIYIGTSDGMIYAFGFPIEH